MIRITCSRETYVYNVYHMVKAFYPLEEAASSVEEKASHYVTVFFEQDPPIRIAAREIEDPDTGGIIHITDITDQKEMKYRIDCALYHALSARTNRTLSWGILMGVRPVKLAMAELERGVKKEQFIKWFEERLFVSPKKARLAWNVAKREKALLDRLDLETGFSLYVGIPFCPSVCSYCSFSSGALSDWSSRVEEYLDALLKELKGVSEFLKEKRLNTIYIGGGTPTSLSAVQLNRLLDGIDTYFSRDFLLEYTVEAGRPDSITREKLKVLKEHNVTRISINPQSMQQKTLDVIGRKHSVEEIFQAYAMAREEGFDNINMDMIAGLPGETKEDVEDTLAQLKNLSPDSLTVHSLAVKRAARMGQESAGQRGLVSGEIAGMIEAAAKAAEDMGMSPYYLYRQKNIAGNFENVGYAKVDKAGIYNILIMEERQSIVAVGAGASTKLVLKETVKHPAGGEKKTNLIRIENVKAIDAYIERIDEMIKRKEERLWR